MYFNVLLYIYIIIVYYLFNISSICLSIIFFIYYFIIFDISII